MSQTEGFGTLVQYGDGASVSLSTSWTTFARIADVEPPERKASDIKITHMLSPGHTHEYQAGLIEPGECKLTIQFTASNQATIDGLLRIPKGYRVVCSDGAGVPTNSSRVSFDGYLNSIGPKTPMEDIVTVDLNIKASGLQAYVAAS